MSDQAKGTRGRPNPTPNEITEDEVVLILEPNRNQQNDGREIKYVMEREWERPTIHPGHGDHQRT